jgi:hypothetical protein
MGDQEFTVCRSKASDAELDIGLGELKDDVFTRQTSTSVSSKPRASLKRFWINPAIYIPPFDLTEFIESNAKNLRPPVGNKLLYSTEADVSLHLVWVPSD